MRLLILADYPDYGGVAKASEALQKIFDGSVIQVRRYTIYDKPERFFGRVLSNLRTLKFLISNQFDVIILKHFEAILVGLLFRPFRKRASLVNVIHTDLLGYYIGASIFKKLVLRSLLWFLKNELIVFDSKESETKASSYFQLTNTKVIYNVCLIEAKDVSFQALNMESTVFGCISRLHRSKNIDLLIRVFNSFWIFNKGSKLLIFGSGQEFDRLLRYAAGFPCAGAIEFRGHIESPQEIYRNLDAVVGLSSIEGFSLVVLEALSRHIPVFHSDCSCGPREILFPGTDPLLKTNTFEFGQGGVLVNIPERVKSYSSELQEDEENILRAFNLFYESLPMIKKDSIDLSRFSEETIRKQWEELLEQVVD